MWNGVGPPSHVLLLGVLVAISFTVLTGGWGAEGSEMCGTLDSCTGLGVRYILGRAQNYLGINLLNLGCRPLLGVMRAISHPRIHRWGCSWQRLPCPSLPLPHVLGVTGQRLRHWVPESHFGERKLAREARWTVICNHVFGNSRNPVLQLG